MQLHILYRGTSKKRLKPVMIDSLQKCQKYKKELTASDGSNGKKLGRSYHYDIQEAPEGSKVWRKDNTSKWTGYDGPFPTLVK